MNNKTISNKVIEVCDSLRNKAQAQGIILNNLKDNHNILEILGKISYEKAQQRAHKNPLEKLVEQLHSQKDKHQYPSITDKFRIQNSLNSTTQILAEIKFASPSAGKISHTAITPSKIASGYLHNGATGLSVLCEEVGFLGSVQYLNEIRNLYPNEFLLQKDFIISPYQILEGRLLGASSFLIIMAMLDNQQVSELLNIAQQFDIIPLIEIHDNIELERVLQLQKIYPQQIKAVGVNNRSLKDFSVNLENSLNIELSRLKNLNILCFSESGITNKHEINTLKEYGYDAFLIGTSFMKNKNPYEHLKEFL